MWKVFLIFNHRNTTVLKGKINIDAVTMKNSPSTKETNLGNSVVVFLSAFFFFFSLLFPIYCFFFCFFLIDVSIATYFFCPQRKERKRWAIVVLSWSSELLALKTTESSDPGPSTAIDHSPVLCHCNWWQQGYTHLFHLPFQPKWTLALHAGILKCSSLPRNQTPNKRIALWNSSAACSRQRSRNL